MRIVLVISVLVTCLAAGIFSKPLTAQERPMRRLEFNGEVFNVPIPAKVDPFSTTVPRDEDKTPGAFETDMFFNIEQQEILRERQEDGRSKRKAVRDLALRWPQNIVPYVFESSSEGDRDAIIAAMEHWSTKTCVEFLPYSSSLAASVGHTQRLSFFKGDGCWSWVGLQPLSFQNPQQVSIGSGCTELGTVAHEIGHALGFQHEQSRPDRDEHVEIFWDNIETDQTHNFNKESIDDVMSSDVVKYDPKSVMHYGAYGFAINSAIPTLVTKRPFDMQYIGQRGGLSFYDVKLANLIYNCNSNCPSPLLECANGGFVDKSCQCQCPPDWMGTLCNEPSTAPKEVLEITETAPSGEIKSPDYDSGQYSVDSVLMIYIVGQPESTITLTFDTFALEAYDTRNNKCWDYVQVNIDDPRYGGNKYCGSVLPSTIVATGEMMIWFYSDETMTDKGFKAHYTIDQPLTKAPTEAPVVTTKAPTEAPVVTTKAPTTAPAVTTQAPTTAPVVTTKAPTTAPVVTTKAPTTTPVVTTKAPTTAPVVTTKAPTTAPVVTTKAPTTAPVVTTKAPTTAPVVTTKAPTTASVVATKAPTTAPVVTTKAPTTAPVVTTKAPVVTTKAPTTASVVTTKAPTTAPVVTTKAPTTAPVVTTKAPTTAPVVTTKAPTTAPVVTTKAPTEAPVVTTKAPTEAPVVTTKAPTTAPVVTTQAPTTAPVVTTKAPTTTPVVTTKAPTTAPVVTTKAPTIAPVVTTKAPTEAPVETTTPAPMKKITSPNYPNLYRPSYTKVYKLTTTVGRRIYLIIDDMAIEEESRCRYDELIIEYGDADKELRASLCGTETNIGPFVSRSNTMTLTFKTDEYVETKGFTASFKSIPCGGTFSGDSGTVESPDYPNQYPNNLVCDYVIEVAQGMVIELTFDDVDIEVGPDYECQYDCVDLQPISGLSNGVLRLDGNTLPDPIYSTGNQLTIRFSSDAYVGGSGFRVRYRAV